MSKETVRDLTPAEVRLAEATQGLTRFKPYRAIRELVAGSDSPNFVWAHWERVNEFPISDDLGNSAQTGFVHVRADEDLANKRLGRFKSAHKKAVILGVAETALDQALDNYKESRCYNPNDKFSVAGAYYDEHARLHAGLLPEGSSFGAVETEDGPMRAIAMRQGPNNVYLTMGVVVVRHHNFVQHNKMLIPRDVTILEANVPTAELQSQHPGVALI